MIRDKELKIYVRSLVYDLVVEKVIERAPKVVTDGIAYGQENAGKVREEQVMRKDKLRTLY